MPLNHKSAPVRLHPWRVRQRAERIRVDTLANPDVVIRTVRNLALQFQGLVVHIEFAKDHRHADIRSHRIRVGCAQLSHWAGRHGAQPQSQKQNTKDAHAYPSFLCVKELLMLPDRPPSLQSQHRARYSAEPGGQTRPLAPCLHLCASFTYNTHYSISGGGQSSGGCVLSGPVRACESVSGVDDRNEMPSGVITKGDCACEFAFLCLSGRCWQWPSRYGRIGPKVFGARRPYRPCGVCWRRRSHREAETAFIAGGLSWRCRDNHRDVHAVD